MNKTIFRTFAIISLLFQIVLPHWWFYTLASFYYFWVEGIFGGGRISFSGEYEGNLLWGLFSIYSIIAIIVSIKSFFSIKGVESDQIYKIQKNVTFLIVNLMTIILSIILGYSSGWGSNFF